MTFEGADFSDCAVINFSDISQTATVELKFDCVQKNLTNADFQTSLQRDVKQALDREFSEFALSSTVDNSETINTVASKVTNEITNTNTQDCLLAMSSNQDYVFKDMKFCAEGGILNMDNIQQTIHSKPVMYCVQKNQQLTQAITDLQTKVTQAVTTRVKESTFILILWICLGLLIVGGLLYGFYRWKQTQPKATTTK